ncbi:zf-HC2 domain-containing protein [Haloechinothrix halophila]|uniref:zf-HC2 domain-containing protein n=1 Tax=Haloechinothrix halophila TaxID=1069073 RepID=UPI0004117F56|nr:zf-HC2 domain-containing protein [Haloechinothrix halophila]
MTCEECREQLSARLDGEETPGLRAEVDTHVAACAACREWQDAAARVTRLARMAVARPSPDLVDAVLAARPTRWRHRLRLSLRVVLALLGMGQLVLAALTLLGATVWAHSGEIHQSHEFAAWNLALGVGFLWIAFRVAKPSGIVPTLAAFVLALTVLEIIDVVSGHIELVRLLSHALVQAGLVVVVALADPRPGGRWFRRREPRPAPEPHACADDVQPAPPHRHAA